MNKVIWSIKEFVKILKQRQVNEFDGNFAVSGERGNGKSTLIGKIFYRFENFDPWKHQVYTREEVINLLKTQRYGLCWDDEAIYSSYKREFQSKEQQELIKNITVNRDNFNVFASAIPNFFSLDKDLRDLFFIHFHIISRGIAVVHVPSQGKLYSADKWDTSYNQKIEIGWAKKMKRNPDFKPPYHRLSTFKGYLYFENMTLKQRLLYKEIKQTKRTKAFQTVKEQIGEVQLSFTDKLYKLLMERKLSTDGLLQSCLMENRKYSAMVSMLNQMLKNAGETGTLKDYLLANNSNDIHNNDKGQITTKIPSYTPNST